MRVSSKQLGFSLVAMIVLSASGSVSAQQQAADPNIIVNGVVPEEAAAMAPGPEIKGVISARRGEKIQVTSADGTNTVIAINEATQIKSSNGLFGGGRGKLGADSLLNGLPVTVKTLQAGTVLAASKITFRGNDLKTANMIRNGTSQRFDEQTAATEALRGRMGDIDKYNIKSTANAYFDTGKAVLSARAKADLCAPAG